MKLLFALLSLLCAPLALAAAPLLNDLPLSYLEQAGNGQPDQPLVIFLHGYGADEQDLFSLVDELPQGYTYLSVRAPADTGQGGYQWFAPQKGAAEYDGVHTDVAASEQRIVDFVAAAVRKYHTRADKVTLIGFSQGAIMNYQVALDHPHSVGAVAVLSGKLLPPLRARLHASADYRGVRWFIGHGTADPVLPVSGATQADEALRGIGVTPDFHVYPGLRHGIGEAEITDLRQWLQP
jgi:phospholipase/carboxylesterase